MKVIDFDAHFFNYAKNWVLKHPELNEQEIEDSYNTIMREWLSQEADWIDGKAPECYFDAVADPDELINLMIEYSKENVNIPELLYSRIIEMEEKCIPGLIGVLKDERFKESLRAEALGMIRDIGSDAADTYLLEIITKADQPNELCNLAADILVAKPPYIKRKLLDVYDDLSDFAAMATLDICSDLREDDRVYELLIRRLKNDAENRALCASYLAKLGDTRAIDTLKQMMDLFDLNYFDYIELKNAVEVLGGEVEEERTFYGDPDYEALRNLE